MQPETIGHRQVMKRSATDKYSKVCPSEPFDYIQRGGGDTEVEKCFTLKLYIRENLILFLFGIWQHCKDEILTQENSVSGNILLRKQCIPKKSFLNKEDWSALVVTNLWIP
jgi:hypothetical protein